MKQYNDKNSNQRIENKSVISIPYYGDISERMKRIEQIYLYLISRCKQRLRTIRKHMSVDENLIKETNLVTILDVSKSNSLPLQKLF